MHHIINSPLIDPVELAAQIGECHDSGMVSERLAVLLLELAGKVTTQLGAVGDEDLKHDVTIWAMERLKQVRAEPCAFGFIYIMMFNRGRQIRRRQRNFAERYGNELTDEILAII